MPSVPPPTVLSFIACERVIQDARTGNHSIVHTLAHVTCADFPAQLPLLSIFAELTKGRGGVPIEIRIVDVDESRGPLLTIEAVINMEPLAVATIVVDAVEDLIFPEPGEYRIQLFSGGLLLLERRLVFVPATQPPRE